ncbi:MULTISPECIES: uL15m family ribosomal protein [Methanothermobacter]|jgi:large subunit ribosomal protein L15|uniref:Large ribosomal subunit protein uL15 n=2 Tax=Methanothermobacter TaxID=145260 RepID=RL15_METTH|nr:MULTISPECIES: uL15 family ribosomal protein [Methanothermobacter]O26133.1 RecName: Full=Large ribosomal subunit protein uL15; AltName: Full=50S ribosomal protein L15 [Methanothermobacter thermautotrophicus str. Delta H]MBC7110697.1 50S ribosomal protein L15 [Methanothermobacter sp.]AAB84534.1 ribosomal protein L27a (E.coli) [Methanothermobacter thermautotrophicus str. Delta H]REE25216.1 LSU ribosomal protein L15P [Methanothermobacter defluvii]WBF06390.1 50S ribosomal protein L15 [Methanothe
MIRKRRKITRMRGSRTVGGGCSKKRRGAGHRGGRGQAGGHKHHWTWIVKYDPKHFGKYGFKRPQKLIKRLETVNLAYLDEMIPELLERGVASEEDGMVVLDVRDLGFEKVLGSGRITRPVHLKAYEFSRSATEKIEEAGGKAEVIE